MHSCKLQFIFVPFILCLLGACTIQTVDTSPNDSGRTIEGQPGPGQQAQTSERLLAQPPANWQLTYQLNNIATRLTEYVPADESQSDWQTKMTFESHSNLKDVDPISIVMGEIKRLQGICSHIEQFNLFTGLENNYPTSVQLMQCGNNSQTGSGEINLTKAIQGNDYLYIIRLIRKVPIFESGEASIAEAEIAAWSTYIRDITLCDSQDEQHPCQPDKTAEQ